MPTSRPLKQSPAKLSQFNRWLTVLACLLCISYAGNSSAESDKRTASDMTASINTLSTRANEVDPELRAVLKKAIEANGNGFDDRFHAEVWLKDMSYRLRKRVPDEKKRIKLLSLVHREAMRRDLQPELVLSVIQVESNFDKFAISRVGARGLMQVMPFWVDEIGHPDDDLFDPETNLRYGCTILKFYLDKEKGNITRALARYNGSLGRLIYPRKVYKALDRQWYPH